MCEHLRAPLVPHQWLKVLNQWGLSFLVGWPQD